MSLSRTIWSGPGEFLRSHAPDAPVLFFSPPVLQETARLFIGGFPGLVTYAVKANPDEMVIQNLANAGVQAFDVASPDEIALVRRLVPGAVLHYNNPVRAGAEIAFGVAQGVASWSVDSHSELDKLARLVPLSGAWGASEIAVRFKLPVRGAAYDFGAKFGAEPAKAAQLLRAVADLGYRPALTFHPGTQCTDAGAWVAYIEAAAGIARQAGVRIDRLNVGGGFPSHRRGEAAPALAPIFARIGQAAQEAFGENSPQLLCEPGRGMVAESFALLTRIRAIRDDTDLFLNDGIYGALAETPLLGAIDRIAVFAPGGAARGGAPVRRTAFGPTCDSVDRLPDPLEVPADTEEGDFLLFHGMGAYSTVTNTRFNGFGDLTLATALSLTR